MTDDAERLAVDGWALVRGALDPDAVAALAEAVDGFGAVLGTRHVLADPTVRALGTERLASLVRTVGGEALLVGGFALDKRLDRNWALPWHRDEQIAVAERACGGSVLEGIPHVSAPRALLDRMLVVRVHIDACDAENGALVVAPGSHLDARGHDSTRPSEYVVAAAGDVVVMRPSLLHRSSRTSRAGRRRVLQLEYAPRSATPPLPWHTALAVA